MWTTQSEGSYFQGFKFEEGMKVKIRTDLITSDVLYQDENVGQFVTERMQELAGLTCTISYVDEDGAFKLNEDEGGHWWNHFFVAEVIVECEMEYLDDEDDDDCANCDHYEECFGDDEDEVEDEVINDSFEVTEEVDLSQPLTGFQAIGYMHHFPLERVRLVEGVTEYYYDPELDKVMCEGLFENAQPSNAKLNDILEAKFMAVFPEDAPPFEVGDVIIETEESEPYRDGAYVGIVKEFGTDVFGDATVTYTDQYGDEDEWRVEQFRLANPEEQLEFYKKLALNLLEDM